MDPSRSSMHPVREDAVYSYANNYQQYHDDHDDDAVEDGRVSPHSSSSSSIERDERYATGGGEPLQRHHSDDNHNHCCPPGYNNYDTSSVFGTQVLMRGGYDEREYYTRQRKRRVKRGIAMIALAPVLIGVVGLSVGFKKGNNNTNDKQQRQRNNDQHDNSLTDFKAEMEKEEELKEQFYAELKHEEEQEQEMEEEKVVTLEESQTPLPDWQGTLSKSENSADEKEEESDSIELKGAATTATTTTSTADHYSNAITKYDPVIYDRSKGWTGQTFKEALVFCQVEAGLALCPYDAVCPEGTGGEPLGGFRDGPHGDWAWVPILDGFNDWVQAGAREKCIKYSNKFGQDPEWGMTGKGIKVEGITQNIMCCKNVM